MPPKKLSRKEKKKPKGPGEVSAPTVEITPDSLIDQGNVALSMAEVKRLS